METTLQTDALTIIENRKSVRHFTGKKVSSGEIDTLLNAAMAAPSAVNMRPWRFIVVTNTAKLKSLANGLPFAKMLPEAGTAIIVCAVPHEAAMRSEAFAVIDCTCASENLLLAAEAMHLGAVWTAVYPDKELIDFVRKQLEIPDKVIPLNVIPVGYPAGQEKPKNKFDIRAVHWETW